MTARKLRGALLLGLMAVLATPAIAVGQYPSPTPDESVRTESRCNQPSTFTVEQGEDISVSGSSGCADSNETDITLTLFSDPVVLAVFNARADGSYVSPRATIPANVDPGTHRLVVQTDDASFSQEIIVQRAGGGGVGGVGGRPGLPRTGAGIAALIAVWGIGILVGGGFLIAATWRRYRDARFEATLSGDETVPPALADADDSPLDSWTVPAPRRTTVDSGSPSTAVALLELEDFEVQSSVASTNGNGHHHEDATPNDAPVVTESAESDVEDIVARLQREIDAWGNGRRVEESSG